MWFAVNAVIADLQSSLNVDISHTGVVTSATQLGFISGTLIFSLFALSDRYSPRKLFLYCSILGALSNLSIFLAYDLFSLLVFRFITGFFLTGIYPIGMKIASGWYRKGLGNAIGFLVGALVIGTAFPHLLKSIGGSLPWKEVIIYVSLLSTVGGIMMYLSVPDGPNIISGGKFVTKDVLKIFSIKKFRSAAFGYFGHMWELYTFWAFLPFIFIYYNKLHSAELNIYFFSALIIASGSIGCIGGGLISKFWGSSKVAFVQLSLSGLCCLISPLMFSAPISIFLAYLFVWGITVAGDSPQYSALIALNSPKELSGTGLSLIISIGFAITIVSLWFIYRFTEIFQLPVMLMLLFPGPLFGVISLIPLLKKNN